jgi:hypothetical protein
MPCRAVQHLLSRILRRPYIADKSSSSPLKMFFCYLQIVLSSADGFIQKPALALKSLNNS